MIIFKNIYSLKMLISTQKSIAAFEQKWVWTCHLSSDFVITELHMLTFFDPVFSFFTLEHKACHFNRSAVIEFRTLGGRKMRAWRSSWSRREEWSSFSDSWGDRTTWSCDHQAGWADPTSVRDCRASRPMAADHTWRRSRPPLFFPSLLPLFSRRLRVSKSFP